MSNELLSLTHGFLGLVFLMAFSGIFVWLNRARKEDINKIKLSVIIMLLISLFLFISGVTAYSIYRQSGGAREFILASNQPWVHNILMELKEFTGFYVLVLMMVVTYFVFSFNAEIIMNKKLKKMLITLLILIMTWALITFAFGVYITKVKPI